MTVQPDTNTLAGTVRNVIGIWQPLTADEENALAALDALVARCEEAEKDVTTCSRHAGDVLIGDECAVCDALARAERAERQLLQRTARYEAFIDALGKRQNWNLYCDEHPVAASGPDTPEVTE